MPVLKADEVAVAMIDHAVGFANLFRSHDLAEHVNNTVALAKTVLVYDLPLVVTNGADTDPSGPLFGQLKQVLGDREVVVRKGNFDAFATERFAEALAATGRRKLLLSGLMTEGCVLQTAMSGLERGYDVHVVVDAVAGETREIHNAAVQRLVQAGAVPVTWLSVASELQGSYENLATVEGFLGLMAEHSRTLGMYLQQYSALRPGGPAAA
ncbi:isochorismatase family protein [Streptomyces mirabilis]|uniref:Isochorismatase family protein n=1 Tax=Streptomyces mirabilis TaxID=68239 RepID=A0ABU3V5M1_9ACTN|nr:isochorismatase family protein [Streptomyces mirabilis]MCX5355819.1 isochorismatase family protein [Streptomyces mirabilis]MDU9001460.1 isochorismatase family protein [Streptomyces mirabilis]